MGILKNIKLQKEMLKNLISGNMDEYLETVQQYVVQNPGKIARYRARLQKYSKYAAQAAQWLQYLQITFESQVKNIDLLITSETWDEYVEVAIENYTSEIENVLF